MPASNTTTWTITNYLWQASAILDDSLHQLGGANLPWSARIDYTAPWAWAYSFGLLFLKRLSDRFEEKAEALMAEGVSEQVAWPNPDEHQVFVPDQARWGAIQKQTTHIGEALNAASAALEEQNRALDPDCRFGCGTFGHPISRHALIVAGFQRKSRPRRVTPSG